LLSNILTTSDQLHLTPVDQIIPLRPQFHHIDAQAEQERLTRTRDAAAGRTVEARALHMSVKSNIDGEESNATSMSDRIAAVQAEPWQRHEFVDSEQESAWKVFNESMFVGGTMGQKTEELIAKVPKLVSGVNDQDYLDMISAPRDKARLAKINAAKASKKVKKEQQNGKGKELAIEVNDDSSSTMSDASSESEGEPEMSEKAKGKMKA
jgi:DNA-directed RNA polymerase-3 subunit RPC5